MKIIKIPTELKKMNNIFTQNDFEAFLVGGAVRDILRGENPHDYDIATNAMPEDVIKIFHKVIPTGIEHGTVTVHFLGLEIEVTTFRTESDYTDGRHPNGIEYARNINEDLSRRDFTMNAIAVSLSTGEIIDPFNGENDIKNKTIKTVGKPFERFSEDGLRPIRAIRFASKLNYNIETETFNAIPKAIEVTKKISIERFRDEFSKILLSEKPSLGINLLKNTGILDFFIPELAECKGISQTDYRNYHTFDVFDHLIYTCDGTPKDNLILRLAGLFHDIGKKDSKKIEIKDGKEVYTFYNHEFYSEKNTEIILNRLKYPKKIISEVCHLIKYHMFHYETKWTDAAIRRFLVKIGKENIDNLLLLRKADVFGKTNSFSQIKCLHWQSNIKELYNRLQNEINKEIPLSIKNLAINGKDLINNGIKPGPLMGDILEKLFNEIIECPEKNNPQYLISRALEIEKELDK